MGVLGIFTRMLILGMVLEWMWELLLVGADVVVECVRVFKRRSPKLSKLGF